MSSPSATRVVPTGTRVVPTKALIAPVLGAVLLNLLARTSADPWLALASAALLALPLAALVVRPSLRGVEVVHRAPLRVTVGDEVEVEVVVRNASDRETPPVRWEHEHPALGPVRAVAPGLPPGGQVSAAARVQVHRRGVFASEPGQLTTVAPFGLISWTRPHLPVQQRLIVHPAITADTRRRDAGPAAATDRSVPVPGAGLEVLDLRPWRPGDARREVSARASARHGRPVVLQRERDAGESLVVLAAGGGAGPAWERAISAAASAAVAAIRNGVQLVIVADPPPSRLDSTGILDFFAGVDRVGPLRSRDVSAAVQRAGRAGSVLVVAPQVPPALVRSAAAAGCRLEVLHGS